MSRQPIDAVSCVAEYSRTTIVYGMAENAKKDAPSKSGPKSGRKAEATKKAAPPRVPAVPKCIYGVNGERSKDIGGSCRNCGGGTLTLARWDTHSHIFKAEVSLMFLSALSDWVMMVGNTPSMAMPRDPKSQKEEEATPVRIARPNGSVARSMSCRVRPWTGSVMLCRMRLRAVEREG